MRIDCVQLADGFSVDSVDQIHQEKKGGRPVSLTLRPNSELMSQLKTLQIQFLHENREWHLPPAHYSVALSADRFFLTVPRPEEILRDFEPSNRRRRHLRPWTLFHSVAPKYPFSTSVCTVRHYFQTSLSFKAYMLLRCSCLDILTVSIRQLRANFKSDECGPTLLGVSPRAAGAPDLWLRCPMVVQAFVNPAKHLNPTPHSCR